MNAPGPCRRRRRELEPVLTDIDLDALMERLTDEDPSVIEQVQRQLARMRADQIVREARGAPTMPPPDLLVAQKKVGKSILVSNFVRALVDVEPFLGRLAVTPLEPDRTIVHFDNELGADNMRRWLRAQRIVNTSRVFVADMRGKLATFNILNPEIRNEWAERIRAVNGQVIIFDCLRPALDALGMSEDKEASRFAQALTALKIESGATDLLLVHHAGHDGSRARGDSALAGWCTDEWKLSLESQDNPFSPRVFSALGRSNDMQPTRLEYDPLSRRLSLAEQSVTSERTDSNVDLVCEAVRRSPGLNSTQLRDALASAGVKNGGDRSVALREAQERGMVIAVKSGRSKVFYPPSAAEVMWMERAEDDASAGMGDSVGQGREDDLDRRP